MSDNVILTYENLGALMPVVDIAVDITQNMTEKEHEQVVKAITNNVQKITTGDVTAEKAVVGAVLAEMGKTGMKLLRKTNHQPQKPKKIKGEVCTR